MQDHSDKECRKCCLVPSEHSVKKRKEDWLDKNGNYVGPHGFMM